MAKGGFFLVTLMVAAWVSFPCAGRTAAGKESLVESKEPLLQGKPLSYWLKELKDPDPLTREDALGVLAGAGEAAREAAPVLVGLLKDKSGSIRVHLLKPIQMDELLDRIHHVMSLAKGDELTEARPVSGRELSHAPAPAATPLHILLAEDDEFSAHFMEKLLARSGHRVRLTTNGREALSLAEEGVFDLLLLDIHMPELDGFEVVGAIRERERAVGGHLPVIALTARSRKEDREQCLAAGMDDFLTKPVAAAALFAALHRLVTATRVSRPYQANPGERGSLLDPIALMTACGDDAEGLRSMCQDFKVYAPVRLAEMGEALRNRDAPRLRQVAHKICSLLLTFSTVAGNMASDVEDHAAQGQLEEAQPLVERLEKMTQDLMPLVGGLSLESLRRQVDSADDREPAVQPRDSLPGNS